MAQYLNGYNPVKLREWVRSQNALDHRYDDSPVKPDDFVDGNVKNCIEEEYFHEQLESMRGPVFRTQLINEKIMEYEWAHLTEKRRRWQVLHWLNSLEKYRIQYREGMNSPESNFWYRADWYNESLVNHLEWLAYRLSKNIDDAKLAFLIAYGIKSIDDAKLGPFKAPLTLNDSPGTAPEKYTESRAGVNVTLHIVDYYSGESDCYGGNDIYMYIYIGSNGWSFTGPEDQDSWSGDATFTAYVTSSTVQITVHVYESDSLACGSDDDYGSFTITYNTVTKTWSGDTSVPYAETSGDDGWADVWFYVESDSDNNPREVTRGEDGAGYLITEYNGKTNYNDPQDTWEFNIDQNDIANKQTIVFQVTPNQNADYDVYLYDPNGNNIASAAHVGDGVIESVVYRLSSSDPTGYYYVVIKRQAGYGAYTFHFDVRDMREISVSVTGLQSEDTAWVHYYKFGTLRDIPLDENHPFFEDICDNQTTLTVDVPSGLYTYDNTSYFITYDESIVVHFYRTPLRIVINEISSVGSGNSEWVELYNAGSENVYLNGWVLTDQDGNSYRIPDGLYAMPPGKYLVIYSGSGSDVYDFSSGYADLYTSINDMWNDDGDDALLIYNGHYIDYVAYARSTGDIDIDPPPSGVNFTLDGTGAWGCAPAPYAGGSVSLVPNGVDRDRASDWFISNGSSATPGTENSFVFEVTGFSKAPQNVSVGATNVYVEKLVFSAIGGSVGLSSLSVHLYGNATESDVVSVKLYEDGNGDGEYNSGDTMLRNTTFSGGIATFSNLGMTVSPGSPLSLFVLVDISTSYTSYHKVFSVGLGSSDVTLVDSTNIVYTPNGSIESNSTEILPVDQAPPYVVSSTVSPIVTIGGKMYVNGNFTVDILFNKDMMTSIDPGVSTTTSNVSKSAGYWLNSRTWRQEFVVYGRYYGNAVLYFTGARDTSGNRMESYSISLYVDTVPPRVQYHDPVPPVVTGDFSVTFHFSESMDTSFFPSVVVTPSVMSVSSHVWSTPQDLSLSFSVMSGIETDTTIYIQDSKDLVGNTMEPYSMYVGVDTKSPSVVQFSIYPNITLDGRVYVNTNSTMHVAYSEDMNTSVYPQITFSPSTNLSLGDVVWLDSRDLQATVLLDGKISGNVDLLIAGSEDLNGNVQEEYSSTFAVDNVAPDVQITMDRSSPVGPGPVNITVRFSEAVDRNSTHFVCSNSTWQEDISGVWESSTLWRGSISVDYPLSSGNYTIFVSTRDLVGNAGGGSTGFVVDTDRPTAQILEPSVRITGKATLNVTIRFSESMQRKTIYVFFGSNAVDGGWVNDTLWKGRYTIRDEYGPLNLTVYGARDIAGNEMLSVSKMIIVDTKGPTVSDISYPLRVDEGRSIKIMVSMSDDYSNVTEAMLYYRTMDTPSYTGVEMHKEGDRWVAYIPGKDVRTSKIEFYVVAKDSFGNEASSESEMITITPWYVVNWWMWLLLAIAILLIILFAIHRRRMREKAKEIPLRGVKPKNAPVEMENVEVESGEDYEDFYE